MFKSRFTLIVATFLVLFVSLAVASPITSDPAQSNTGQPVVIPQDNAASRMDDFHQRHSEENVSAEISVDMSDYFTRHPEPRTAASSTDSSDYYQRHSGESVDNSLYKPLIDECFDVSLSELAACREASQSPAQ